MTDTAILTAWYDHKDAVYRFAWRMTGSPSIAEDVLQEVFLALVRTPERFDGRRAPLRAFLLAVARNQVRKRWEKERRWHALDDHTFEAEPVDPLAGEVADSVARAVQSLPPLQREALVLFEYEDLSLEEVARTVDAEVGAIKSRLNRARENLRLMLAPLKGGAYGAFK
jgi:RNA polymerase sigma-70 factor (ECF subfamily)